MSEQTIRVVIADDHAMVRKGLRLMVEEAGENIVLVGEAPDGRTAVTLVEQLQPDVVLMDVRMPALDGIAALKQIRAAWPHVAVIILTTYDEDDLILRGMRAGASGYLLKDTPLETLLYAIRTAARGEMLVQPAIMARLLTHLPDKTTGEKRLTLPMYGYGTLTKREREVLAGLARGERSKEIAAHLGITERTVRAYLTSIYTKLNVDSRTAAIAVAVEHGLLSGEEQQYR